MFSINFKLQTDLQEFLNFITLSISAMIFSWCNILTILCIVLVMNNVTMADEEEETEADENICPPGKGTSLVIIKTLYFMNDFKILKKFNMK